MGKDIHCKGKYFKMNIYNKRIDLRIIADLVAEGSRVLDIGCGNGDLLAYLREKKDIVAYGVDISENKIANCVSRGLCVSQLDVNEGLVDFKDKSFDYVILSQTLQVVNRPDIAINEVLRVGKKAIISIPNFAHWECRFNVAFRGIVPVTEVLPFQWYNTPNSRVLSIKDFRTFCKEMEISISNEIPLKISSRNEATIIKVLPNLRAQYGIFEIQR